VSTEARQGAEMAVSTEARQGVPEAATAPASVARMGDKSVSTHHQSLPCSVAEASMDREGMMNHSMQDTGEAGGGTKILNLSEGKTIDVESKEPDERGNRDSCGAISDADDGGECGGMSGSREPAREFSAPRLGGVSPPSDGKEGPAMKKARFSSLSESQGGVGMEGGLFVPSRGQPPSTQSSVLSGGKGGGGRRSQQGAFRAVRGQQGIKSFFKKAGK
jgi:hypothetical protein